MSFKNKTIWITGASSGIGEQLAYAFSKQGARLILSARRKSELERVAQDCHHKSQEIMILPLDVTKYDELSIKTQEVLNKFGKIDILINNAGISHRGYVKDTEFDVFKRLIEVDYLGVVALTKAVLPNMLTHSLGHIVTVSSLLGKIGIPNRAGYCGAKHALHGFMDALRLELSDTGIKVTTICPGFVRTNIAHTALNAEGNARNAPDPNTENGMKADKFARLALKSIEKGKREAYIGGFETWGVALKRVSPTLYDKVAKKKMKDDTK